MEYRGINLQGKFETFSDRWSPKIIAQMNDYHFKLVKLQGEIEWHSHPDTDEVFLIVDGHVVLEFRAGQVAPQAGELFVVPRGVEHNPFAAQECRLMLIEPAGTLNTGDAGGERTVTNEAWI